MGNNWFLFLDDERYPCDEFPNAFYYTKYEKFKTENWEIVRNFSEFTNKVNELGIPKIVSFDCDLKDFNNGEEKTGYDCAKWLCNYCQDNNVKFPEYFVHSMNSVGAENITRYIENYKRHVE